MNIIYRKALVATAALIMASMHPAEVGASSDCFLPAATSASVLFPSESFIPSFESKLILPSGGEAAKLLPVLNLGTTTIVPGKLDVALPVVVVVDKQKHLTHVLQYQTDVITDILCVRNSVGKPSTPTPEGHTVITQKQFDPTWKPPVSIDPKQRVVQPWSKTHKNPLGVANLKLGLDHGMIALHGTNEPRQIGKSVSHGCIRHCNDDILKVAAMVHVGTPVYVVSSLDKANIVASEFSPLVVAHAVKHVEPLGVLRTGSL